MSVVPRYISLKGCYFSYYGVLGVLVPYLSVFLSGRGFDSAAIGVMMSSTIAMRIIGPNLWSILAQWSGRRLLIIRIGIALTFFVLSSMWFQDRYALMLLALAAYNLCWNGIQAQVETHTLNTLGEQRENYSKIRAWGSIGFIVVTLLTGIVVTRWGSETVLLVAIATVVTMFLFTLPLSAPQTARHSQSKTGGYRQLFRLELIPFWLSLLCLQASHGPYYTFFVLYLREGGYSATFASMLVSLGVIVEITMFMASTRLLSRFGGYRVLLTAMGLTVVRWLMLGYCRDILPLLLIEQSLHAASFALTHVASILMLSRRFRGPLQSSAQALYASFGFGLGGALGTLFSGWTWHDGAGALWTFQWAALAAFVGFILVAIMPQKLFNKDNA